MQLIDASGEDFEAYAQEPWRQAQRNGRVSYCKILEIYHAYEGDTDVSKVYPNSYFGYRKVTVDRPLQLNVQTSAERMDRLENEKQFINSKKANNLLTGTCLKPYQKLYMSRDEFLGT